MALGFLRYCHFHLASLMCSPIRRPPLSLQQFPVCSTSWQKTYPFIKNKSVIAIFLKSPSIPIDNENSRTIVTLVKTICLCIIPGNCTHCESEGNSWPPFPTCISNYHLPSAINQFRVLNVPSPMMVYKGWWTRHFGNLMFWLWFKIVCLNANKMTMLICCDFYHAMLSYCGICCGSLSICLSQVGVPPKWLNVGSWKHTIAQRLYLLMPKLLFKFGCEYQIQVE